jgi:hypothetical protein
LATASTVWTAPVKRENNIVGIRAFGCIESTPNRSPFCDGKKLQSIQ